MLGAVAVLTLLSLQAPPPPPMLGDPADDPAPAPAAPLEEDLDDPDELKPADEERPGDEDRPVDEPDTPRPAEREEASPETRRDDRYEPDRGRDARDADRDELNELYETPEGETPDSGSASERHEDRTAPEAWTLDDREPQRPAAGGDRRVDDDVVPPADPLQEILQVDAGTYLMHVGLVCAWAFLMTPMGCVPCLSWVLYPGAVGLGVDQIGRYLTHKRGGGLLVPAVTFLLVEMVGTGLGVAAMFAAVIVVAALAVGSPELSVFLASSGTGPPLVSFLVYGGLFGVAAAATVFGAAGATAAWHVAARDDRGDALFEQLNPFDPREERDDGIGPRRPRRQAALDRPVTLMRY